MKAVEVFIGLGSNLGNRLAQLQCAVTALAGHPELMMQAVSPVYETEAHTLPPHTPQPAYLNAVLMAKTCLTAEALLAVLLAQEQAQGRKRSATWAARTLDLDLLIFGDQTLENPQLRVPHPRLAARRFVLKPLLDLAPDFLLPLPFAQSIAELWAVCRDPHPIFPTEFSLQLPSHA